MIQRRAFLTGLASAFAAPAIVRAASLMPVRGIVMDSGLNVPGINVLQCGGSVSMWRVSWDEHWEAFATEIIHPSEYLRA